MITRRTFLSSAAAAAVAVRMPLGFAEPLGLPLGLQLYSVRKELGQDFDGTLAKLGELGYREVEAAGFFQRSASDFKAALAKANLRCVSSHAAFGDLQPNFDERLAYAKELGIEYLICSSPGFRTPPASGTTNRGRKMTIDDWRYNAEQFNLMGEKASKAGIRFGYHNHTAEVVALDGVVPLVEMLRITDPAKVTFEMDCGWVIVGGGSPVKLMQEYPNRFSMLHVKDFKAGPGGMGEGHEPTVTELGQGSIDYGPIFAQAAKTQKIKHIFVEQEAFDVPWAESLRIDAEYLRKMKG